MTARRWVGLVCVLAVGGSALAQQVPDLDYNPPIISPAYPAGKGPRIAVDEGHFNFHTVEGRYQPLANLLRRDGYRVDGLGGPLSQETLAGVDALVIANALNARNVEDWSLPTPSAFSAEEVTAIRNWVWQGGSLFLIADHMPFPGAAGDLARAFGVEFSNGYAQAEHWEAESTDTFEPGTGLRECAVTRGRSESERVTRVATFTGSAFRAPNDAFPVLVFGAGSVSRETTKAPGISPDALEVPIDGWCQGALVLAGRGRVAVFGEAAMFSAQLGGPQQLPMGMNDQDAGQNHQLLLNVMHWLTRAEGMPDR